MVVVASVVAPVIATVIAAVAPSARHEDRGVGRGAVVVVGREPSGCRGARQRRRTAGPPHCNPTDYYNDFDFIAGSYLLVTAAPPPPPPPAPAANEWGTIGHRRAVACGR